MFLTSAAWLGNGKRPTVKVTSSRRCEDARPVPAPEEEQKPEPMKNETIRQHHPQRAAVGRKTPNPQLKKKCNRSTN